MKIIFYGADCTGNGANVLYPYKIVAENAEQLAEAVCKDHIAALCKNNYRSGENFISAVSIDMDVDNDFSNNPADWMTPEKMAEISGLGDTQFACTPSRHNMKQKDSYSPRPRFHVQFVINEAFDVNKVAKLKRDIFTRYPFFDEKSLDAVRSMFGAKVSAEDVLWHEGSLTIDELFNDDFAALQYDTIPEGSRNSTMSHFAGCVLKRYGICDEAYRIFLERAGCCSPALPDNELSSIWKSACKFYKTSVVTQEGYISPDKYASTDSSSWDEPLPLTAEKLPEFPIDALPSALRDYASCVAESTQTSVDMAAVGVLTTASACMRNLYKVEGKPDWQEPTNIYSVIIADPSERKSANIALCTKPIDEYVYEYNSTHRVEFEMSRATKQRLENKRSALISGSKKKGSCAEDFNDELRDVVEQLVNFEEKKPMRVYVDDTTPEKLVETLSENNSAASIISSEGGIFDVLSGSYSNKVNIDVFLKAYSGDNISVDRIMRNSITVKAPCLTMLLSVQPVVISDLMKNSKFRHRGLTARFLYTTPKSLAGDRNFNSKPIPYTAYDAYKQVIYDILSEKRDNNAEIIRLTKDAVPVLEDFYNWVEKMIVGEFSFYSDWIGKLVGNTLRIAGVMARCSVNRRGNALLEAPIKITPEIMRNAIRIGRYFFAHAINAYSSMGVYANFKSYSKALDKIKEKNLRTITRRDLMRNCRWLSSADEAQDILNALEDYCYVKLIAVDPSDKLRGCKARNFTYAVNPKVFS